MEVEGEKANDGTRVNLWQNNDKPHQRWQLAKVVDSNGEVFYTIGHPNSTMVMESPGPWRPGDPVVMRDYESDGGDKTYRQWKLVPLPGGTNFCKIMNRRSGFVIDVQGGASGTGLIKQYAPWDAPDGRQHWEFVLSSLTEQPPEPPVVIPTPVPVVVEVFDHPLGVLAWVPTQRSAMLTSDTPFLQAGNRTRVNPIAEFSSEISTVKIHPGPDHDPQTQYEVHLFRGENYQGDFAVRTLALGEPNLHLTTNVGDSVRSVRIVALPPITLT